MANEFFNVSGVPASSSSLSSSPLRGEYIAVQTGFDKLPALAGQGDKLVTINAAGTAVIANATPLTTTAAAGTNTTQVATTAFVQGAIGANSGLRNKIINGDFDFWQRNTTQTGTLYGSDDRWSNEVNMSTHTVTRVAHTVGGTLVKGSQYFSSTAVVSTANVGAYAVKAQFIEGVRTFEGKTVTVSFIAKADNPRSLAIEFIQSFGTGGSPSARIDAISPQKIALTTSFARYTATVAIPSISGKVIGTDNNDFLGFYFWFDAGSNFNARTATLGQQSGTFMIGQVQIEEGSVATAFDRRPLGTELALCQRYYEKSYARADFPGAISSGGYQAKFFAMTSATCSNADFMLAYKVTKRSPATVVAYSSSSGVAGKVYDITNAVDVTATIDGHGDGSARIYCTFTATTYVNLQVHYTAEAEL